MDTINNQHINLLHHFIFKETDVDVTIIWENGRPLFRAIDIAKVLDISNIRTSTDNFDNDEKVLRSTVTLGGEQNVTMLTERGLYRLIFNCRKPIAKKFQKCIANIIVEIQYTGKFEIEKLKKEIHESKIEEKKSVLTARHNTLLDAFHNKNVVYFGMIKEENDKTFIKIGSTIDIRGTFLDRHPKDYGNIIAIHAFECSSHKAFESFLLKHTYIKQFLYDKPVKINRGISREVILVTDNELKKILRIVSRNIKTFINKPTVESTLLDMKVQITELTKLLHEKHGNNANVDSKFICDLQANSDNFLKTDNEHSESSDESDCDENIELSNSTDNDKQSESLDEDSDNEIKIKETNIKQNNTIRVLVKGTGKCEKCDAAITRFAKRCVNCSDKRHRFEITKDELENLVNVQKLPFTVIGQKYGVSDNAIRKRCRYLGVTVPKRAAKKKEGVCQRYR